jgi:hypothetical protein
VNGTKSLGAPILRRGSQSCVTRKSPISKARMQASLSRFLAKYPAVHIIADWPEDIERFCALLITGPGKMLGFRQSQLTLEVNFNLDSSDSKVPHQALADARAMKFKHIHSETD